MNALVDNYFRYLREAWTENSRHASAFKNDNEKDCQF